MIDPINLEIFNNLFASICEEMGAVLKRSSFSTNIKERRDFSCALFDNMGEMVAQAEHLPVHLASMSLSVKSAIKVVDMDVGDCVIVNDPYQGGTHLPDITMVMPFFYEGSKKPLFYVANRAHHADVGGMSPGSMCSATEIYQEGVRIPPIRIVKKGELNEEVLSLILANVRASEERRWDISAQLSANRIAVDRLNDLCKKYGGAEVLKYSKGLMDYSERFMRSVIHDMEDGFYSFYDFIDSDGISDEAIKIQVGVTVSGDEVTVDFSGSNDQVKGCLNAVYAVTVSAVFYVFRCLVDNNVPSNAGCMRPLNVIAPLGTIVNAKPPSAVSAGNVETSQRIVDVVFGALANVIPDKVPAASCGTMNNIAVGGYDSLRNSYFTYYETIAGGMGARPNMDGISAVQTHMTNTMNTPVETIEHKFPFRIKRYEVRRGSGGKGLYSGGDGIIREYEFLDSATVTMLSDRRCFAPYGLNGGKDGMTGGNYLISNGKKSFLSAKFKIDVKKGDVIGVNSPGGGGYGKP